MRVAGTVEAGVSAALCAELFNENSKRGRGVRLARNLARSGETDHIAGRPGYRPGHPVVQSRVSQEVDIPGAAQRGGAAAICAAAAGACGYYGGNYNNGCYQDSHRNWVYPNQHQC